jgi:hypothetical protein
VPLGSLINRILVLVSVATVSTLRDRGAAVIVISSGTRVLALPFLIMSTSIVKDAAILCGVVKNEWKVNAIESGQENYYTLMVHSVGRKYIKVVSKMNTDPVDRIGHAYMFIDKVTGKCYGVKSWNQADSLVRGTVTNFIDHPEMCSPYGGFAYLPKHN